MFRDFIVVILALLTLTSLQPAHAGDAGTYKTALNGLNMGSFTDDDTRTRAGLRYGTRHHMNDPVITVNDVKVTPGDGLEIITLDLKLNGTYKRIEFSGGPGKETVDQGMSERVQGTWIKKDGKLTPVGNISRVEPGGDKSGDGRNKMYDKLLVVLGDKIGK